AGFRDGLVSYVDLATNTTTMPRLSSKVRAISPHPSEPFFAFVDGETGSLFVQTFEGRKIAQLKGPPVEEVQCGFLSRGLDDCLFDKSGNALWVAAHLSADVCKVSMFETKTWNITKEFKLKNKLGSSSLWFHETGRPDLICLENAADQDGQ